MASYLDKTGLTTLWSKMKSHVSSNYLSLGGGTITGTLDISNAYFGPLSVTRSGSSYYAGIQFVNNEGTLGSIGMTAVDGSLVRLCTDTSKAYKIPEVRGWDGSTLTLGTT